MVHVCSLNAGPRIITSDLDPQILTSDLEPQVITFDLEPYVITFDREPHHTGTDRHGTWSGRVANRAVSRRERAQVARRRPSLRGCLAHVYVYLYI